MGNSERLICVGRGGIVMSTDEFSEKAAADFWSWFRGEGI
jgi:hypothetical protein